MGDTKLLEDRVKKFEFLREDLTKNLYNDFHERDSNCDLLGILLNVYKIHMDVSDSILEIIKHMGLWHISSGILLRTLFENYAIFAHLCEANTKVRKLYLKKINVFDSYTESDLNELLKSDSYKTFSSISAFDDSKTEKRIAKLGKNIHYTYKMLSAYTHASPQITKQLTGNESQKINAKHGHLSMLCITYESLLALSVKNNVLEEKYDDFRKRLKDLVYFPEN